MQQRILIATTSRTFWMRCGCSSRARLQHETVNSPADLLAAVARKVFDILLIDLNYARDTTSGREGLDVLSRLREIEDAPPWWR